MSNNLLIVESQNDKYFIEAFTDYLNLQNIEVDIPICKVDDYECLAGISNLEARLSELKPDIEKGHFDKIGIILDADSEGIQKRIELINQCLHKMIGTDATLTDINTLTKSEELEVEIACYINNVDGQGELETLLRVVKSQDSIFADCLNKWHECLESNGKSINNKQFDKFWINIYQRFDTCSKKEQYQAHKKCSGEISMKKDIWDFEHEKLNDLRKFLQLFS
ncbi:MAG: DUF3226 domain-containing protein [Thiotrichaceae bacterium]|nr:DUF3226 domain-containing protein [Thiotrichaceae bacterium]